MRCKLFVMVAVLVLAVGIVSASTVLYTQDFESGSLSGANWQSIEESGNPGTLKVEVTDSPTEGTCQGGTFCLDTTVSDIGGSEADAIAAQNETLDLSDAKLINITAEIDWSGDNQDNGVVNARLWLNDTTGSEYLRADYAVTNTGNGGWAMQVTSGTDDSASGTSSTAGGVDVTVKISINRTAETAKLYEDGNLLKTATITDSAYDWSSMRVEAGVHASPIGSAQAFSQGTWDDIEVVKVVKPALLIDVKPYMKHGSKQQYKIIKSFPNGTTVDVTDSATVTSSDSSTLTVYESNTTLVATNDDTVNKQVTITANESGLTTETNVTVANKTLDNIGILPPPTWPCALLCEPGGTTGATSTWPGSVQLQWIFVSLVVGALASWALRNDLLGVGTTTAMLGFGWAISWVSNGVLIAALLFVAYVGMTMTGQYGSASRV